MVIWLRAQQGGIGIERDVVRAAELAQLIELDRASGHFERRADELLASARREAETIQRAAEEEAERVLRAAQTKYDNAARLGYEAGRRRAIREAHEAMLHGAASERDLLVALRERIADIVMRTVTRVLGEAERDALFAQIAVGLSRSLEGTSFLTVRVAECDLDEATRAFRRVCDEHRWPVNPEVVSDAEAEPGSCVCEWDHGLIEAGLPMQLRAIASAIRRVTRTDTEPQTAAAVNIAADELLDDAPHFDDQQIDDPQFDVSHFADQPTGAPQ
ncbi:type III secretion system stator protein SctL [Paraburkholderia sp. 22099]|jgi:type III secretion protein L|uniref:type III secretion system stator protein SctL n=1 Tax=Paraburkholderia TaxID=1822464 RepID=UPI00286604DB|nr:type III secretion system stator protein SctL [Paraburkholderia terricola]MDR6491745.1 type III secretion protein L [Paraburkholderia terricola]